MNKADRFYFDNLCQASECAFEAANYLFECLDDFNYEGIRSMLASMHELEHKGDTKKHEMTQTLAKAFVTPIEREDLALLSQNIDEVTDSVEEILQGFYIYQIKTVPPAALNFTKKIIESCRVMKEMFDEFINFKKPAKLHDYVVELNRVEEECDEIFIEATRALVDEFKDPLDIISWREMYNRMERCADACEHVGDTVDLLVMKNT